MRKMMLSLCFTCLLMTHSYALDDTHLYVRTTLPDGIKTIGEAAQHYAESIGYTLKTRPPAPMESARIAEEPLSILAVKNQILPIDQAILNLIDERYLLVIDKKHKLFSFEEKK